MQPTIIAEDDLTFTIQMPDGERIKMTKEAWAKVAEDTKINLMVKGRSS